jgi:hypothetical protein
MHPSFSHQLAQDHISALRRQAERAGRARAAQRARPRRRPLPDKSDAARAAGVAALDFDQLDTADEAGRVAAREALERAPASLIG